MPSTSAASPAPDPAEGKAKAPVAFPPLPEKQRQFCGAYQDQGKLMADFEAKVAAAGNNPIARQNADRNAPDFNKFIITKVMTVMTDNSFQDWIGYLDLNVAGDRAFVTVQFPCPGTLPFVTAGLGGRMSFGNEWRHGFVARPATAGIPIDSPLGQSLATLKPGELVAASGSLACKKDVGCFQNFDSPARWADFSATFTAVRSLKANR